MKHADRNSWLCPGCDQYNGWTEEGDYNKDLDLTANSTKRFVSKQDRNQSHSSNGLCLNCNLNQELKISQLARFPREGPEFEEYRAHLETVYRLCPECDDVVSGLLAEQDRGLAAKLLGWRLENSRLSSSRLQQERTSRTKTGLEAWLGLAVLGLVQDFSSLSVPGCLLDLPSSPLTSMFPHISVSESLALLLTQLLPLVLLGLLAVLTVLSVLHKRLLVGLLYLALLGLVWTDLSPGSQLFLAVLGLVFSPRPASPSSTYTPASQRSPTCVLTPPPSRPCEEAETRTQDLLSSSDGDLTTSSSSSPLPRAAPIKSTSQISFNHEFSTTPGEERDCDLSSLSIEDFGSCSPSVRSASTFQLRSYSPVTANTSLFSPSQPLLRPARLTSTSWVAGGYWTPPTASSPPGPALSRASSQSSGFISATPSLANYQHQLPPLHPTPSLSLFSEPLPGPVKLRRRTVEDSISDLESPGQAGASRDKQSPSSGWTFTVTVTPTGILLGLSLIVNITLVSLWYSS